MKIQVITIDFNETEKVDKLESTFYSIVDITIYTLSDVLYYVNEFEGNSEYDFYTFKTQLEEDLNKLNISYKLITYKIKE